MCYLRVYLSIYWKKTRVGNLPRRHQLALSHPYEVVELYGSVESIYLVSLSPSPQTYKQKQSANIQYYLRPGRYRLSILAPIPPNMPIHAFIQTLSLPQGPDFTRSQAFINAIIPFSYIFCESYFFGVQARVRTASAEKKLKSLLCPLTRTNPNFCNPDWIDQFSRPNKLASCASNLLHTVGGEIELSNSSVSTIFGPFGFS